MVRNIFGVVVGLITWMVGFYLLAIALSLLWPDYALHGRQWTEHHLFAFTPLMACATLALWVLAEIAAGWLGATISKSRAAVWVLAGLLGIYLVVLHLAIYWASFPWWYNLGVVIPAVPAVLLGARLAVNARGKGGKKATAGISSK